MLIDTQIGQESFAYDSDLRTIAMECEESLHLQPSNVIHMFAEPEDYD